MENRVMAIAAGSCVMAITYALAQDITVDTDVTGSVWVWVQIRTVNSAK